MKLVLFLKVNTAPVFVDCARFTVIDLFGLSLGPIRHINAATAPGVVDAGATTGATPLTPAQIVAAAAVTANATNQALIAQ